MGAYRVFECSWELAADETGSALAGSFHGFREWPRNRAYACALRCFVLEAPYASSSSYPPFLPFPLFFSPSFSPFFRRFHLYSTPSFACFPLRFRSHAHSAPPPSQCASSDKTAGVSTLLGGGLPVFAFLLVLYAVHVAILLGVPALMRAVLPRDAVDSLLPRAALLTASNACIGGPATASALAVGNGWPSLVVPSVLVGNLGYAIATFLGILFHRMVLGI
eukprot:6193887-Pleurochrysis_carterae.AAC.6